ncbi:hypothetical protein CKM354_000509400 [Cercospora kikuchii]|uniref:F-box domain-containing protein n=1 Tax=Cercospora kikuchii TaxID=84275 RepID=A0A9P3CFH0_9PEZI|nr:uncharacterized protein CKM354_000509400 [Cercospora kikuchii]GIZ41801.1 hypothetical protein CKM354_000509400 [Cercospora kikuchii]
MDSELKLSDLINALPSELKDQILEHIIVATLPRQTTIVVTDTSYTPPWQLSLSRLARRTAAPIYYGTIIFEFGRPEATGDGQPHSAYDVAFKWLRSLSLSHLSLVHSIYLPGGMGSQTNLRLLKWKENLRLVRLELRLLASLFARDGVPIAEDVLQQRVTFHGESGLSVDYVVTDTAFRTSDSWSIQGNSSS